MHRVAVPNTSTEEAREQEKSHGERSARHDVQDLHAGQLPPHGDPPDLRDAAAVRLQERGVHPRHHPHDLLPPRAVLPLLLLLPLHRQFQGPRRQGLLRLRHPQGAGRVQARARDRGAQG
ncbi:unnamed protein product [Linum tenue]|uniref:Uncharacterized protein n=1 Tax=Linum tenue TaxID=586396 RepID=A0AAV0IX83_9ROSI|nr:unnamed protein product [Linum tenue]